jgi:hypothetical protein
MSPINISFIVKPRRPCLDHADLCHHACFHPCIGFGERHHDAEEPHAPGLLRVRAERPIGCQTAEQRDEFALLHVLPSGRGLDPITLL